MILGDKMSDCLHKNGVQLLRVNKVLPLILILIYDISANNIQVCMSQSSSNVTDLVSLSTNHNICLMG